MIPGRAGPGTHPSGPAGRPQGLRTGKQASQLRLGARKSPGALTSCSKSHTTLLKRDLCNCRCFKILGISLTPWILPFLSLLISNPSEIPGSSLSKNISNPPASLCFYCHSLVRASVISGLQRRLPLPLGPPFHSPCSCQNGRWKTPVRPCTGFLPHWERSPGALPDPTRLQLPLSSTSSHLSHAGFAHGQDLCISVPSAGIFSPPLSAHTSPFISSVFGAQLSSPPSQPSCTFLCGNSPALQPPSPPQSSPPPGTTLRLRHLSGPCLPCSPGHLQHLARDYLLVHVHVLSNFSLV